MLKLHYLQHVPFEGLGCIATWAEQHGHFVTATRLYRNEVLPSIDDLDFLVVLGGPMNVYEEDIYPWLLAEKRFIGRALDSGKSVLGICLGAQLMATVLGARVYANDQAEIGWFPIHKVEIAEQSPLAAVIPSHVDVLHWHGDTFELPSDSIHLAASQACPHQGFALGERALGLQFHLETTPKNLEMLIHHCRDEIIEAPFVQSPEKMMAYPQRFATINTLMFELLEALTK